MQLSDFSSVCRDFWDAYFRWVLEQQREGLLDSGGAAMLFPSLLLCTQTKNYLIAELIGASQAYNGLVLKERKQRNIKEYLTQFPDEEAGSTMFILNGGGMRFMDMCLSRVANFQEAESRFRALRLFPTRLRTDSNNSLFAFGPSFCDVGFSNCILLNTDGAFYRAKYVVEMLIAAKSTTTNRLRKLLLELVNRDNSIKGVTTCNPNLERDYILASQLQTLYLTPHLHETTVGEFLRQHPEVINQALGTDDFVYEPYLEWIEAAHGNTDAAINPDAMVKRPDGYFDIVDLKTALLEKKKTTRGERKRRRFIDVVNEGIAQLANYAEYFGFEKNREHALAKYGIKVQSPQLFLVVGHYDNTRREEVEEALRPYKNVSVLDYDSIVQLFLARASSTKLVG
jgi:Domain of unknown function (DUF4263)